MDCLMRGRNCPSARPPRWGPSYAKLAAYDCASWRAVRSDDGTAGRPVSSVRIGAVSGGAPESSLATCTGVQGAQKETWRLGLRVLSSGFDGQGTPDHPVLLPSVCRRADP